MEQDIHGPEPTAGSGDSAEVPTRSPSNTGSSVGSASSGSRIHIVRRGELFEDIAALYGVSVDALVAANRGKRFVPGAELVIPGNGGVASAPPTVFSPPNRGDGGFATQPAPPTFDPVPPTSQPSLGGRTHVIRRGETFFALARLYFPGQSQARAAAAIQAANPGVTILEVGQVVNIPSGTRGRLRNRVVPVGPSPRVPIVAGLPPATTARPRNIRFRRPFRSNV